MERLRQIENSSPSKPPPLGCDGNVGSGEQGHALKWDGWWQSGNPEVAIPRWKCSCGRITTDAPRARWFLDGRLGPLFHDRTGHATPRP